MFAYMHFYLSTYVLHRHTIRYGVQCTGIQLDMVYNAQAYN